MESRPPHRMPGPDRIVVWFLSSVGLAAIVSVLANALAERWVAWILIPLFAVVLFVLSTRRGAWLAEERSGNTVLARTLAILSAIAFVWMSFICVAVNVEPWLCLVSVCLMSVATSLLIRAAYPRRSAMQALTAPPALLLACALLLSPQWENAAVGVGLLALTIAVATGSAAAMFVLSVLAVLEIVFGGLAAIVVASTPSLELYWVIGISAVVMGLGLIPAEGKPYNESAQSAILLISVAVAGPVLIVRGATAIVQEGQHSIAGVGLVMAGAAAALVSGSLIVVLIVGTRTKPRKEFGENLAVLAGISAILLAWAASVSVGVDAVIGVLAGVTLIKVAVALGAFAIGFDALLRIQIERSAAPSARNSLVLRMRGVLFRKLGDPTKDSAGSG